MTDRSSAPRRTPLAGHWTGKVATSRWCHACERLHTTRRHAKGEEPCPKARCWMCEHPQEGHDTVSGVTVCRRGCSCEAFLTPEPGATPRQPYVHKGLGPKRANPFAGKQP